MDAGGEFTREEKDERKVIVGGDTSIAEGGDLEEVAVVDAGLGGVLVSVLLLESSATPVGCCSDSAGERRRRTITSRKGKNGRRVERAGPKRQR